MYLVRKKFLGIPKEKRLAFLKARAGAWNPLMRAIPFKAMRGAFNRTKGRFYKDALPCYVCDGSPTIRHHVVPLSQGGRNKDNNIVPLCNSCHKQVHPWMH